MTKSKLVNAQGKIVRANLHPTKRQVWNGSSYRSRARLWASKGFVEVKWSR